METVYQTQSTTMFRILKVFENVWGLITDNAWKSEKNLENTNAWFYIKQHISHFQAFS